MLPVINALCGAITKIRRSTLEEAWQLFDEE